MRAGSVGIVGRTNVGKSTLFNALLGTPLAIVSPLPQTTRDALLGVVHQADLELAMMDTPGLHRPKHELGRRLNHTALEILRTSDVLLFVTDVGAPRPSPRLGKPRLGKGGRGKGGQGKGATSPRKTPRGVHPEDVRLIQALPAEVPVMLVINKVDLLKNKAELLPLIEAFSALYPFAAYAPVSVKRNDGLDRILEELGRLMPEGSERYTGETLTDRSASYFVREYVREQVMLSCWREVPHAVAVTIDEFETGKRGAEIKATIHVEKSGQRGVLIGEGGRQIQLISRGARKRLATLLGSEVKLTLFVRVTESWKNEPRRLAELGYEEAGARSLTGLLRVTR